MHRLDDEAILAHLRELDDTRTRLPENAELLRLILPALRADYRALETYECEPGAAVDVPITVFVGGILRGLIGR